MSKITPVDEESEDVFQLETEVPRLHVKSETPVDPFSVNIKEIKNISPSMKKSATRKENKLAKQDKGAGGTGSKQINAGLTAYSYLDVVEPPYNLEWLSKLVEISPYHQAAIDAKVSNIVGVGFNLVESPKLQRILNEINDDTELDKKRKKVLRQKDQLSDYIDELNDDDGILDALQKVWADYESLGFGCIEIGRKEDGQIGYVGHIPARTIRVRRKRDGFVQVIANQAIFFRNFQDNTPDPINGDSNPNEIIMISRYSSKNSYYGTPSIISAMTALAGNEFASKFNIDYFENKAVPRHLIVLKGANLPAKSKKDLFEFFETGLKGVNHRSLYVPLPADTSEKKVSLEIKPVETGVQEGSFEKYTKLNANQILMAHRVPPSKVGMNEGISIAAALDAAKTFRDQVCVPSQKTLARKINKIMKELTDMFLIEFEETSLTDEDTQSKIDERYLRMGVIVPNDVRARMGKPGVPWGDKPVDLSANQTRDIRADARQSRQEDADRSAATSTTNAEGRNAQGEGRRE